MALRGIRDFVFSSFVTCRPVTALCLIAALTASALAADPATQPAASQPASALKPAIIKLEPPAPPPAPPVPPAPAAPRSLTDAEIALRRKLDQPFDLTLQKVELSEAFKQIAVAAQISLQVDPACYDALPYGATTLVTAEFRQSQLKSAIEQVLLPLGLQQTISGATVVIRPSAPLAHIGRRADWDELKLLQDLRTSPDLKPAAGGGAGAGGGNAEFDWTAALRASLDSHPNLIVAFTPPPTSSADTPGASPTLHDKAMEQLKKQLPLSPFQALELYCHLANEVWFVEAGPLASSAAGSPAPPTVRIMPLRPWIERQLERPIQLSFTNAPLDQVVGELAHASGIRLVPAPGLYRAVPFVSLSANNCSARQALETLSGVTGIAFDVRDDSILLHMAGNSPSPAAPPASADAIVARIAVPVADNGVSLDVLIHESDLTPQLNELRKKKIAESLEALQKAWSPPPTTQPAKHP